MVLFLLIEWELLYNERYKLIVEEEIRCKVVFYNDLNNLLKEEIM